MQISELKTQMAEFRRRLEESTSNQNISKMATIDNNAASSSSGTGNSSSSTSGNLYDTVPSVSISEKTDTPKNIKPRSATIILKRRIAESTSTSAAIAAKLLKRDPIDDK